MQTPYELLLGWRYTRAGRSTRRNGFISFISAASIVGIALGVAALIIVLSVMNGFQKEVRDRMLGVVSHIEVMSVDGSGLQDVPGLLQRVKTQPEVVGRRALRQRPVADRAWRGHARRAGAWYRARAGAAGG